MTKDKVLDLVRAYKAGDSIQKWAGENGMTYQNAMNTLKKLRDAGADIPFRGKGRRDYKLEEVVKEINKS